MATGFKTGGRQKGTLNKNVNRTFIEKFLVKNEKHVQSLFDDLLKTNPAKALDTYLVLLEYSVGKRARVTEDGQPDNNIIVRWQQ